MSKLTIKSTATDRTSASDLIKASSSPKEDKFLKILAMTQIDYKAIRAEAYSIAVEEAEGIDSFIAEKDVNRDGLSIEHQEQKKLIEVLESAQIDDAEQALTATIIDMNKQLAKSTELFSTEWTSDNNKVTIRSKYILIPEFGIVIKELKTTPTRETYTVGQPTITGLRAYRGELSNNEELAERFDELAELHNQHALLVNGLEPSDALTFLELSVMADDDSRRKTWASQNGQVWINIYDNLFTSIKNEANKPKAQISQKRRDF